MSEEMKKELQALGEHAAKLPERMIERLSDIAYGMTLVKDASEQKQDKEE